MSREETVTGPPPHGARAVANYLIDQVSLDRDHLTSMQLLKLVYIAHGWNLAVYGRPLIREPVEAWAYGPVVADLYHGVKRWGAGPVRERLRGFFSHTEGFSVEEEALMSSVLEAYRDFSGLELSNLTHRRGTPWFRVYYDEGGKHKRHALIPDQLIEEHFVGLLERLKDGE